MLANRDFLWNPRRNSGSHQPFRGKIRHFSSGLNGEIDVYHQSYIFRNSALEITARMVRSHGAVVDQKLASSSCSATSRRRSFRLGRADTLPSYRSEVRHQPIQTRNISAPIVMDSPPGMSKLGVHCEEVGRPDLAHHPAMGGRI